MSWLDRIYVAVVAILAILCIVGAVRDRDPVQILGAILYSVWLFAMLMRMRAQPREGRV